MPPTRAAFASRLPCMRRKTRSSRIKRGSAKSAHSREAGNQVSLCGQLTCGCDFTCPACNNQRAVVDQ